MTYSSLLELLKTDMKQTIDNIDLSDDATYEIFLQKQKSHKHMLKHLVLLNAASPTTPPVSVVKPLDEIIENIESEINAVDVRAENERQTGNPDLEPLEEGFPIIAPLERVLKGGVVRIKPGSGDDTVEFIPEHLIRDLDIDNGDLIKIYAKTSRYNARKYEVVERLDEHTAPADMKVIPMAVVSHNETLDAFVIKSCINDCGEVERFRIDTHGVSFFKLNYKDVESLDVQVGDIIDAAYYEGNGVVRIRWRYDLELDHTETALLNRKKATYYKDKSAAASPDVLPIFAGNTISIFGAPSSEIAYRDEIEKRGGVMNMVSSKTADVVDTAVKGSDLVLIPISETGHTNMDMAKAAAKKYSVPFRTLRGRGRSSLVSAIAEGLGVVNTEPYDDTDGI